MSNKVHVIKQEDLIALHQIAGTVRVFVNILSNTEDSLVITNKALFDMVGGLASKLESITQHINNGDC